jgi:hypothetical protein
MIEKIYTIKKSTNFKTIKVPDNARHSSYTCRVMNDGKIIYTPHDPFKICGVDKK